MDHRSRIFGIGVTFAVVLFFFGASAYSDKDHVQKTRTNKEKIKSEPARAGHDHTTLDHDEEEVHEGHMERSETGLNHETGHEGDDHRVDSNGHSSHSDEPDHESHDHDGGISKSVDDGHGPGKGDHGEGTLELSEAQKREINLTLEPAGPGNLHSELSLMGEIRLNEDRVAHVVPKLSGVVLEVGVSLGDEVKTGQILASIESTGLAECKADYLKKLRRFEIAKKTYERKKYLHEEKIASKAGWLEKEAEYLNAATALKTAKSMLVVFGLTEKKIQTMPHETGLQFGRYELRAPMSGTVIEKHITMGEKLSDDSEVFTISDLSRLWVDLKIPARDIYRVKQGSDVVIQSSNGTKAIGTISLIGPVVDEVRRTALARLMIDNRDGRWKPGTFVTGYVRISVEDLPVVVPAEAVQNIEGKDGIFVQEGDDFRSVPVVVGRRDRNKVEIISGLKPGTSYVTRGAFELKAMIITSSLGSHAGHGH